MRRRAGYAAACLATVALGLASRRYAGLLPPFIAAYAGDVLWALMVYLLAALSAPRASPLLLAGVALAICFAVEISQAWTAPWLETVRTLPGARLVLGHGFLWSDLACYTAGVGVGVMSDLLYRHRAAQRKLESSGASLRPS